MRPADLDHNADEHDVSGDISDNMYKKPPCDDTTARIMLPNWPQ